MMNGSATKRPASAPIFIISMKPSVGAVYMNLVPVGISCHSGSMMNRWICCDEDVADDAADDEGVDRGDQSFPELVEMLQERHLSAGAVVVLQFFVVRIARSR